MINKFKGKKRHRYRSKFYMRRSAKYGFYQGNSCYPTIKMPLEISIHDDNSRSLLIRCVKYLHENISRGNSRIRLDFSDTRKVYSPGMLLFCAEIENLFNLHKELCLFCRKPRNKKISHVLNQVGLYKKCRTSFSPTKQYSDVIHWRECSGKGVISDRYDSVVEKNPNFEHFTFDLYGGCVEATKNVTRHAYIEERDFSKVASAECEWWIFTQMKDNRLTVNICDLGLSIPKTLPITRRTFYNKTLATLATLGRSASDADLISLAIHDPTSRSGESYRGNGLPKIANIAKNLDNAYLEIYSRNGYIRVSKNKECKSKMKIAIPGTIISWSLPIGESVYEENNFDCR